MSIVRANPAGWQVNSELTSTQANTLDLNCTYAVDKRAGYTDSVASTLTFTGAVTFNGGASAPLITFEDPVVFTSGITFQGLGTFAVTYGSTFEFNSGAYLQLSSGAQMVAAAGSLVVLGQYASPRQYPTISSGNVVCDLQKGNVFDLNQLTANTTIFFQNATDGQKVTLRFQQGTSVCGITWVYSGAAGTFYINSPTYVANQQVIWELLFAVSSGGGGSGVAIFQIACTTY